MTLGSSGGSQPLALLCMPGLLYPISMAVWGLLKEVSSLWHLSGVVFFLFSPFLIKNTKTMNLVTTLVNQAS